jgi:short-subunit dehydrogenase
MAARGRGGIVLIGSMAGFAGSPATSVYNAAKAFSRIFAEGLWYELGAFGVDVVELVVGAMRTPAMERRGMTFGPDTAEPAAVAEEALDGLGNGPVVVSRFAGGTARAEAMSGFPRAPLVEASADGLRRLGLLP